MAKGIVGTAADALTEVVKGAAIGAIIGAVDAGAKVAGVGSETETNVADAGKKSKTSIAKNTSATTKKPKSGK